MSVYRRNRFRGEAVPQAIDPASGFKVPLSNLVKQWDGEMIDRRFVDRRNPQDFVRGVRETIALPYARPESPDRFMASNILTELGEPIFTEDGGAMLQEGLVPVL